MATQSEAMTWSGRILSALIVLMMTFSAVMKFQNSTEVVEAFQKFGYPDGVGFYIAIAEITSVLLYLIPQTAVLGAIVMTGYLGGAIATHVRAGEPFITVVVLGIFVWLALYLRDSRIRALIPFRSISSAP